MLWQMRTHRLLNAIQLDFVKIVRLVVISNRRFMHRASRRARSSRRYLRYVFSVVISCRSWVWNVQSPSHTWRRHVNAILHPTSLGAFYFFLPCASVSLSSLMKTLMTPSGTSSTPSSKPGLTPTAINFPSAENSIVCTLAGNF